MNAASAVGAILAWCLFWSLPLLVPLAIAFVYSCGKLKTDEFKEYCESKRVILDEYSLKRKWAFVKGFVLHDFIGSLPSVMFAFGLWGIATAVDPIWQYHSLHHTQTTGLILSILLVIFSNGFSALSDWMEPKDRVRKLMPFLMLWGLLILLLMRPLSVPTKTRPASEASESSR